MQDVLIEKPYTFVPAVRNPWLQRVLLWWGAFIPTLRRDYAVYSHECRNLDLLRESLQRKDGVLLISNHPRGGDAVAYGHLARETPCACYVMASWHLFNQGWRKRWMIRVMGAFSVNREGLDRQAIDEAIRILQTAERPLMIFPEGTTSHTNDILMSLMEGPAFIARTAAKRRAKQGQGRIVVHPVAIKYVFQGDLERACDEVLTDIERKLTWRPSRNLPLIERLIKVGNGLLTLKELEHGLSVQPGTGLRDRQTAMVNHLLHPLEQEWLGGPQRGGIAIRIKNLRMKIFPEVSRAEMTPEERARRWRQLEETYLAQQIDCYPDKYVNEFPSQDRILETVEKFEEDLTDHYRVHGPMKVILDVAPAIEVSPERDRGAEQDPLMMEVRARLEQKLAELRHESRIYQPLQGSPGA